MAVTPDTPILGGLGDFFNWLGNANAANTAQWQQMNQQLSFAGQFDTNPNDFPMGPAQGAQTISSGVGQDFSNTGSQIQQDLQNLKNAIPQIPGLPNYAPVIVFGIAVWAVVELTGKKGWL